MNSIHILVAITVFLSITACNTQIKNATTERSRIHGNGGMCESAIEKAGNVRQVAQVEWNKDTKMATLTYDTIKTNQAEILKRIAMAGYDSESFLAPDDVYAKLPECCRYDRMAKSEIGMPEAMEEHSAHNPVETNDKPVETQQKTNQLKGVFEHYFALKDALVKSDGTLASSHAKALLNAIHAVQMNQLSNEEHMVWMQEIKGLASNAQQIEQTKDVGAQRDYFDTLSERIYQLLKVSKQEAATYYQHCPMANDGKGANWLSKEKAVKNPYYGSAMLSCGKVIETIE